MTFQLYSHPRMFEDDAPDVAPSTEYPYWGQQKAIKTSENNPNAQILQTTSHSSAQEKHATVEHVLVTNTSDERIVGATASSWPDGNTSSAPANDPEANKKESHVRRPSLTIPIALCLIVVTTSVNIRFVFTAFV